MQFATPSPCVRCKKTLVKPGGMTGMCKACRLADPDMVAARKVEHAEWKKLTRQWFDDNFEPVPGAKPGYGGAIRIQPKKGSKVRW